MTGVTAATSLRASTAQRRADLYDYLRAISPRIKSTDALAEVYGVSARTIDRDVAALRQAGAQLVAQQGKRGGYAYDPRGGCALVLTRSEAKTLNDLLAGVVSGRLPVETAPNRRVELASVQQKLAADLGKTART